MNVRLRDPSTKREVWKFLIEQLGIPDRAVIGLPSEVGRSFSVHALLLHHLGGS